MSEDVLARVSGIAAEGMSQEQIMREIVYYGCPPRFICPQAFHWYPGEGYTHEEVYEICKKWARIHCDEENDERGDENE